MENQQPPQDPQPIISNQSPQNQFTNTPSKSRSHSRSRSPSHNSQESFQDPNGDQIDRSNKPSQKGPALDFLIFLSKNLEVCLTQKNLLQKISNQIGDITMEFDYNFRIPEYGGCLLKIKGENIKKKRDATQDLLEFIVSNNLDQPVNSTRKFEKIEIVIMIPNGLVSMVIGTRGKQISTLIKESRANIVINQPIYKMTFRTVSISGRPANIADAIMNIQQIMEDRYNEVSKIEFECKPLNVKTTQTNVKLIVDRKIADGLTSKKQPNMIDILQDEYSVALKIYQDRKNRQLDHKDYICSFQGTIEHVQAAILEVTRKIKNDIRTIFDGKKSYTIRMLINKVFVTKLIGAGGCMIQEIANFSKGASIKIMSNKHDEKKSTCHDIPVCIGGSFCSVQDATCIIIEQMECFKNGGPVLQSGKSLHQNIAIQFINSIFTSASAKENEDEHIYTLKGRLLNAKRDREDNDDLDIPPQKINSNNIPVSSSRHGHRRSHSSRSKRRSRSRSSSSGSYYNQQIYQSKYTSQRQSDLNNNFSYEENGIMKISTDIIVPDHLVNILIGRKGENVRAIMSKTGSSINFSKEYNDDCKINTNNGIGRICNLKGTPAQNAMAMQMISEMIIKYEPSKTGSRREK